MKESAGLKSTNERGLLVVSFGTSHEETCRETIGAIEAHLAKAMPSRRLYRGWTSRFIIKKLRERDGTVIDNVEEAMERMASEGITDVLVVPTHMIPGGENDRMMTTVREKAALFDEIRVSRPLLSDPEDIRRLAEVIAGELLADATAEKGTQMGHTEAPDASADRILVLMGHGSADKPEANRIYVETEEAFRSLGYDNVFVGTVEGQPSIDDVIARLGVGAEDPGTESPGPRREILLAPMMIVAGDHAINDMAGESEDSWKSRIEKAFGSSAGATFAGGSLSNAGAPEVRAVLRGLGAYEGVRHMFLEHAERAEL